MDVSRKFAKALSEITGVSRDWLLLADVDSEDVPSERGGLLRHEEVVSRVKRQIQSNLEDAEGYLVSGRMGEGAGSTAQTEGGTIQQQMAATIAKLVESALRESLDRGDTRLMVEITRLLARQHGGDESRGESIE